ncbi:MAG TPA: phosphatidate cytidylyltransferase [Rugosimonospora sp.]|jgi:phosphatidate cytidylyltransferase
MSYLDPPDDKGTRSRHRARHAEVAAPEAYPEQEPRYPYDDDGTAQIPVYPKAATDDLDLNLDGGRTARSREERASDPSAAPRRSRAGRNLPAAIGVGVTLGAIVIASLFVWRPAFLGVVVVAAGIGVYEMVRAVGGTGVRAPLTPLLLSCPVMIGLAWRGGTEPLILGLTLSVVAALIWRLADGPAGYERDLTATALIAVYVPFLASFAVMLVKPQDGPLRVVLTLAAVVLSDTGGYAAGVFFGKHPMAPTVSPKKSWEGLAGSLVATAAGGAVLIALLLHEPWWHGVIFGVAVSISAVVGDLTESLLKRDIGVKDMSNLLPGHGGLMDRLDSILFAAPAAFLLLSVLAPVGG